MTARRRTRHQFFSDRPDFVIGGVRAEVRAMGDMQRGGGFFPGFDRRMTAVGNGIIIHTLVAGSGPPLLLLHGHPETHVAWWKVAPTLAERFTVVATDLRGYGDSSKPDSGYSKREMANDQVAVMKALGFDRFQVMGHDRGGRVIHRMAIDHPDRVERAVLLDIAPTDLMYAATDEAFATKYFWWFFHIQKAPLPEQMIQASTEIYLRGHLDVQSRTPGAVTDAAFAEYYRCYREPGCIHAVCEDYRASVGVDREQFRADQAAGKRIEAPLLAIWGSEGTIGKMFDVVKLWKEVAANVEGKGLPCGHLIAEERSEALLETVQPFLRA